MMDISYEKFARARAFKMERGYENFFRKISRQHPICIFGSGLLGKQICTWMLDNGIKPQCFCDNNMALHGKNILADIQCVSFEKLKEYRNDIFIIVAVGDKTGNEAVNLQLRYFRHVMRNPLGLSAYWSQMFDIDYTEFYEGTQYVLSHVADVFSKGLFEVLVNLRLQDRVTDYSPDTLGGYYSRKQYIVHDIVDYSKIKTYVDCGAYEGDSLESFINLGTEAEYYCFEMDQTIFKILQKNSVRYSDKKIHLYPYGVGASEGTVPYRSICSGGSKIDNCGTELAHIVALDTMDFEQKIDFIKMDIEGAEEAAIRGAELLIKRDYPILAISIYHNFSQFVNVVKIIKDLNPKYKIYIRHHKYTLDDTVCYAVPE